MYLLFFFLLYPLIICNYQSVSKSKSLGHSSNYAALSSPGVRICLLYLYGFQPKALLCKANIISKIQKMLMISKKDCNQKMRFFSLSKIFEKKTSGLLIQFSLQYFKFQEFLKRFFNWFFDKFRIKTPLAFEFYFVLCNDL